MSVPLLLFTTVLAVTAVACGDADTGDIPLTTVGPATTAVPVTDPPPELDTDAGVTVMPDGDNLALIVGVSGDGATLSVDLAVWFSGDAANEAAAEDGAAEVPVPNDYYIRNADPTVLEVAVSPDVAVTSVWLGNEGDGPLENHPVTYDDFLSAIRGETGGTAENLRHSPWWVLVENGSVVALDEQYVP